MNPPRDLWLEVEGLPLHAAAWSPREATASATAPVLLVHGLGGSTVNWHLSGQPLADALGREVLAIDLPGFGRTPPAGRSASIGSSGRVVRTLLRDRGPTTVIANSMGGAIAVGLAARHPDLVDALVLVNPALPIPRRPAGARALQGIAVLALAALPVAGPAVVQWRARRLGAQRVVDSTLRTVCARPERIDPELRRRLVELAAYRENLPHAGRAYHDAVRSITAYLAGRMEAEIASLRPPTMLIHGTHDRLVPADLARRTARQRPDWHFELLEGCGHVPHMEVPERFVPAVADWLQRVGVSNPAPVA